MCPACVVVKAGEQAGGEQRGGETKETIVAAVLEGTGAELFCQLDGLSRDGNVAQGDGLGVDITGGGEAVTVADVPGAASLLGGRGLGGVVDVVTLVAGGPGELRAARQERGEYFMPNDGRERWGGGVRD